MGSKLLFQIKITGCSPYSYLHLFIEKNLFLFQEIHNFIKFQQKIFVKLSLQKKINGTKAVPPG